MWEIPTETLLSMDRRGLLPLLPLTREGRQREAIEMAIDRLIPKGEEPHHDLLSLVYGFASLVFEHDDQEWLRWRFSMLYDILRESPAFQEMAQEGRREGFEQGIKQGRIEAQERRREGFEQGIKQGRIEAQEGRHEGFEQGIKQGRIEALNMLRRIVADQVTTRFANAELTAYALHILNGIDDVQKLHLMIVNLTIAQTPEAARHLMTEQP
jgi:predicted transposase YdaD